MSLGLIDYLVPSYLIKLTMVGGGVAAVYFLSIQSKRFVPLMNEIVASIMILFSTKLRSLLPNRSKLHSAFESNLFMSKPRIISWRKFLLWRVA